MADKQIEIIACLTEGRSIRSTERITGIHRDTIMRLGARVGRGSAELHDRMMVGLCVGRIELDELWAFVGKKQKQVTPVPRAEMASSLFALVLLCLCHHVSAPPAGYRRET